jgi:hypothetical protein
LRFCARNFASYSGRTGRVALRDGDLVVLQARQRGVIVGPRPLAGGRTGRELAGQRADDLLGALEQVGVDLVGVLVAVARRGHARRPALDGLDHAPVLEDSVVELVELALQLREHLRAAEDLLGGLERAAAEAVEVAAVDGLLERRARVLAPERTVVGAAVGRAERRAQALVGVGLGVAAPPQGADPVAELLEEVRVAQAARADERGARGERVDRDVVEALVLHALGDRRLDAALAREDSGLVEAELVLDRANRLPRRRGRRRACAAGRPAARVTAAAPAERERGAEERDRDGRPGRAPRARRDGDDGTKHADPPCGTCPQVPARSASTGSSAAARIAG